MVSWYARSPSSGPPACCLVRAVTDLDVCAFILNNASTFHQLLSIDPDIHRDALSGEIDAGDVLLARFESSPSVCVSIAAPLILDAQQQQLPEPHSRARSNTNASVVTVVRGDEDGGGGDALVHERRDSVVSTTSSLLQTF